MRLPLYCSYAGLAVAVLMLSEASYAKPLTYALPEESSTFRPGAGREAVQSNCLTCHSADYINTEPPNRGKAFWEAEVTKMIEAYHAPINEADAKTIADYLAKTY